MVDDLVLIGCDRQGAPEQPLGPLPTELADFGQGIAGLYGQFGHVPPWIGYFAVRNGEAVGGGAFVGPPLDGRAEIAYLTLPDHVGQGCATATAAALVSTARAADATVTLFAKTLPKLNASTSILERLGFERDGIAIDHEIGEAWAWVLRPDAPAST